MFHYKDQMVRKNLLRFTKTSARNLMNCFQIILLMMYSQQVKNQMMRRKIPVNLLKEQPQGRKILSTMNERDNTTSMYVFCTFILIKTPPSSYLILLYFV